MRQKLLLCTLLLVIAGYLVTTIGTLPDGSFSIGNWYPLSGGAPSESQASPLRATPTLPAVFNAQERHKVLYDPYRLKIDSRFLLAVEEVSHLVTGPVGRTGQGSISERNLGHSLRGFGNWDCSRVS